MWIERVLYVGVLGAVIWLVYIALRKLGARRP